MRSRDGLALARASVMIAAMLLASGVVAAEPCGICDDTIVTNSALARCFLDRYPSLASKAGGAIVVDLSTCETERGIVPPLAEPGFRTIEPSITFMVTPAHLDCLKSRLEQGTDLDPSATIELGSCK